jgi:trehalose synthase
VAAQYRPLVLKGEFTVTSSSIHALPRVAVGRHLSSQSVNVENYRSWVGDALIDEILELSRELKGLRICNVNATAAGGGVAELLSRMIPVHLALGLSSDWRLIYGDKDFFAITKTFHNALEGADLKLSSEAKQVYLDRNRSSTCAGPLGIRCHRCHRMTGEIGLG